MKIQSFLAPPSNQIPGLPDDIAWVDSVLKPRDDQIRVLTIALQNQVGFDNLNSEIRTLSMRHDVSVTVEPQTIKGRVVGVIVLESNLFDYTKLKWRGVIDGVEIAVKWDSAPPDPVDVTFLLLGN